MGIQLELLGRPRLAVDGAMADLPYERRNQLLVYLAVKRNWVGRSELAAMLWPDLDSKLAHANLRKTLFRLQSLPWAGAIDQQGNALRVDAATDVEAFETAIRERRLPDALALAHGEFLAGFDGDAGEAWTAWLGYERARLRTVWRTAALERLAEDIDSAEAIDLTSRMLQSDPIDEDALRTHMTWLARTGQQATARRAYRDFVDRLQRDYELTPGAELQALHDTLLGTLASLAAPPRPTPPANDGFVGRTIELQDIAAHFAEAGKRLVTLGGPGGAGKTRLARRVLQELGPRFADGAKFIALEEVQSPESMWPALVQQLGLGVTSADPKAQVFEALRTGQRLLVLDNFEQIAAAAPLLDELLTAAPDLRMLVTSRMRLGLAAEQPVPVHGLPWPDPEDADRLEAFDAVRLFVRAAQRLAPGFAPTEVTPVIEICRRVEGLPLALELAAAWTRVLSCEQIAAELRRGAGLLHASDATVPARHASLEVVFEQSWALLTAAERDALARLSVFRGGFDAAAARVVAGSALAVLGALVDKSLLRKDGARLHLHPVVRQLAAAKLQDDERTATESAHARYYLAMLAQLRRPTELADNAALEALEIDGRNCAVAWRWGAHNGLQTALVNATGTLRAYSDHRGRTPDILAMVDEALAANPESTEPRFVPVLLSAVAHFHQRLDRFAESMDAAQRALKAARGVQDPEARLRALNTLGACTMRLARNDEARRYYQRALTIAASVPNPRYTAVLLQNLAQIEKRRERPAEALRMLLQALEQFRIIGDHASEALCLYQLGAMQCDNGDMASGVASLKAGLAVCESHKLHRTRGYVLTGLTDAAIEMRDYEAAERYAVDGLQLARLTGARLLEAWMLMHHARLAVRRRDIGAARKELRSAAEVAIEVGSPVTQMGTVICFGEVLAGAGELDAASRVLGFARSHAHASIQDRRQIDFVRREWQLPDAGTAWPGLSLPELCVRIAGETPMAHAPLIAAVRGC